jgi:NAD(P)H-dependent flavin oxidoreductase YrpB (nitropropane dioxygenase family)
MDQGSIVQHLARKELAAVGIYENLVGILGAEAIGSPLVTRYLREAKSATSNPEATFLNRPLNVMIATKPSSSPSMNDHFRQYANSRDSLTY